MLLHWVSARSAVAGPPDEPTPRPRAVLAGGGPIFGAFVINGFPSGDGYYEEASAPRSVGAFARARFLATEGVGVGVAPSYEWVFDTDVGEVRVRSLAVPIEVTGRVVRLGSGGLWLLGGFGYSRSWHEDQRAARGATVVASGWTLQLGPELWFPVSARVGAFFNVIARFDNAYFQNGWEQIDGANVYGGGLLVRAGVEAELLKL